MAKRMGDTDIWSKDWYLDLTDKQKLLVRFLFDNCDCAGFYEISKRMLRVCFEQPITREDFEAIKQVRFINENTIFIEDFINFHYNIEISQLNEKYNLHKGIIRRLNKYGIFSTLSLGLGNPCPRVQEQEKEKEKENNNTLNKQIDNLNINNDEENFSEGVNEVEILNRPTKKIDPYINPINEIFSKEYQKVFKNKPYLLNNQRNKLIELAAEIEDFKETIPVVIEKLKNIDFDLPNFTANYTWLLKDDNYIKVLSGTYDKKKSALEKEIEEWEVDEYGN